MSKTDGIKQEISAELDKTWDDLGFANKAKLIYYGIKTICGTIFQKDDWRDHGIESLQSISKSFFIKKSNDVGKDVGVKLHKSMSTSELIGGFLDLFGKKVRKKICDFIDSIDQDSVIEKLQKKGFNALAKLFKKIDLKLISKAVDEIDPSKLIEGFKAITLDDTMSIIQDINQKNIAQVLGDFGFAKLAVTVKSESMTRFLDSFADITIVI